jgi:hypothetical protein
MQASEIDRIVRSQIADADVAPETLYEAAKATRPGHALEPAARALESVAHRG